MKRRIFAIALILVLVGQVFAVPSFAMDSETEIQPYYVAVRSCAVDFSIENSVLGYSKSQVVVSLRSGYTADVTMELIRIGDSSIKTIKTWEDTGLSDIEEVSHGYYVASGYDYLLDVTIKVYNSDGEYVATVLTSDTEYY